MQGQLGEKLIADLIREAEGKKSSGLLRLTKGKAIKAVFFESGSPVFAISNLAGDQLEERLVRDGPVTADQINEAKERVDKNHKLGPALVKMGVLTEEAMRTAVREQVTDIIVSLFEWDSGEYTFDERIRASHEVTLDCPPADILLEGARRAAEREHVSQLIAPNDAMVARSKANGYSKDSGRLVPIESYVLSRIEAPTPISEVGALSGIAQDDAHKAVCALISAGFLKLVGGDREPEPEPGDDSLELLQKEISRRMHFYASADFYEVLEVNRQATTAEIKTAYYQLAKRFHPDRYRQPEHQALRAKLEALFARITQAYETLSEPATRLPYDEKVGKSSTGSLKSGATPEFIAPSETRTSTGSLSVSRSQPISGGSPSQPLPEQPAAGHSQPLPAQPQSQTHSADFYYQQGRARYDRKEYHAAVHLLREAVKLDPGKAPYHFHLGIALIKNPRTRREAEHHLLKAAELDPYNSTIRAKLGLIYKEAGLSKRAETCFREALQMDPTNRVAMRELGVSDSEARGGLWKKLFKKKE